MQGAWRMRRLGQGKSYKFDIHNIHLSINNLSFFVLIFILILFVLLYNFFPLLSSSPPLGHSIHLLIIPEVYELILRELKVITSFISFYFFLLFFCS